MGKGRGVVAWLVGGRVGGGRVGGGRGGRGRGRGRRLLGGGRASCERGRERRRKQERPLRREADGHAILPDRAFAWPQCPTGRTQAQSELESGSRRLTSGAHAAVDVGSIAASRREFCDAGMGGSKMAHRIGP